ncbi:MAG: hypothetical protein V1647_05810 [Pseudomonadota bacterium]
MISATLRDILPDKNTLKKKLHVSKPVEENLVNSIYDEAPFIFTPEYSYKKVKFSQAPLSFMLESSCGLKTAMDGALEGFVVICTIGGEYKKSAEKYGLYLDRFASDLVENLAEHTSHVLLKKFYYAGHLLTKRYSPGYGDLKLDTQKDIFALFGDEKISITLTESFYMDPEKSISYIVGVKK